MANLTFKVTVMPFNRDADKLDTFLLQCKTQFEFNKKAFDKDKKKVMFVLSKCEGGMVGPWAHTWFPQLATFFVGGKKWKDFVKDEVHTSFQSQDAVAMVLATMKALQVGGEVTVGDYVAKYRMHQYQASLTNSQVTLIKLDFLQGLPTPLSIKLQGVDPDTINTCKKLYQTAQCFDESWRALNPPRCNAPLRGNPGVHTNKMTVEECKKCMSEGRCFLCKEVGHRVNECLKKMNT